MLAMLGDRSGSTRASVRVCLCDDVRQFRELMRFTLDEDPAIEVVCEAADGTQCVEIVASARPDVVLLDLSMPGRDGLEVIADLRRRAPSVAIVVLSGYSADRMADTVLEHGATRYVEKGAPLAEIRAAVREAAGM